MAIPGFQDIMLPTLQALAATRELRAADLVNRIADHFGLTPEEREQMLPSGRQATIADRTHWAITYLGKAKLIERPRRGVYPTTGRDVPAADPARIDLKLLDRFPELREFRGGEPAAKVAQAAAGTTDIPPDELLRSAYAAIEADRRQKLMDRVLAADPAFFERLVVQLLVAMGFGSGLEAPGRAIGRAGDGGLDGVIDQDWLGLDRVYVQAKRYTAHNAVGPAAIHAFLGSLDTVKAAKGILITISRFTPSAVTAADRLTRRIVLVDGGQLASLMLRYDVGARIEETIHVKRIDEDFFNDEL